MVMDSRKENSFLIVRGEGTLLVHLFLLLLLATEGDDAKDEKGMSMIWTMRRGIPNPDGASGVSAQLWMNMNNKS